MPVINGTGHYLADRSDLPGRMRAALSAGQPQAAALLAHNLISTAGALGAMLLSDQARALQQAIDAGQIERYAPLLDALAVEHRIVGEALQAYLATPAATV